jgi:GTP-binding protein HflX
VDEHLEELARLADTAGAQVVGTLTQQLDRPHPGTYLGSGKVEELKQRIQELGATLVIFDDELSPAQQRNWEKDAPGLRVIDRQEVILDIFASRATTKEAVLQVELARLQQQLPRLKRLWSHLDRQRGGGALQRDAGGFVEFRKQGQKYLYKFKNQFMIGDVNAWEAE